MPEIIPGLLVHDQETFEKWLHEAEQFAQTVQIDILDNSFVENISWADPEIIKSIKTPLDYELHLMVNDVEKRLNAWTIVPNVKRAIFHIEPFLIKTPSNSPLIRGRASDVDDLLGMIAFYGWETGLAINPDTPIETLDPFLKKINVVLFLGYSPGWSGQEFQESILEKIQNFKQDNPKITIAADGGVDADTIPKLAQAGVELFDATSSIFKTDLTPKEAYKKLLRLL